MTLDPDHLAELSEDMLGSIELLLGASHVRSALILIFSGVDILGALDTDHGGNPKDSFVRWSEHYMDPLGRLGCSGLELYSARCGLVHSMSPETNLTRGGSAREFVFLIYPPAAPPTSVTGQPFVVHVGSLWLAFRDGARQFVQDAGADPLKATRVQKSLKSIYVENAT